MISLEAGKVCRHLNIEDGVFVCTKSGAVAQCMPNRVKFVRQEECPDYKGNNENIAGVQMQELRKR